MPKSKVLGQLLLMQSYLLNLPDKLTIFKFVQRGLMDIPGISDITVTDGRHTLHADEVIQIRAREGIHGLILIYFSNKLLFEPYRDFLLNFVVTIELVLDDRVQKRIIEQQQARLEQQIAYQAKELNHEIKQRQDIASALTKTNELFRTSFENTTSGVCILSTDGRFLRVNNTLCEMFGYEAEELIGKSFNDVTHRDDYACGLEFVRRLLGGELKYADFEKRYLHKSGRIIYARVSTGLLRNMNNEPEHFITYITDITQQKETDRALAITQHQYRLLFDNMAIGFSYCQLVYNEKGEAVDFNYLIVNKAYAALVDIPAERVVGSLASRINPFFQKDQLKTYEKVVRTGLPVTHEYYTENARKFFEVTIYRVQDEQFAILTTDITQQKEYDVQLKRSEQDLLLQNQEYESLNEELTQINEELYKAKERAEESDTLKSAFLANMSHEIRTPMNGLIGFSKLINAPNLSEEKRQHYATVIEESCKRLLKLVNDIIDISKIETGQITIYNEKGSVFQLLQELFSFFEPQVAKKGIDLKLEIPHGVKDEEFVTDFGKLSQIFNNLLSNALKFTTEGTIKFGIARISQSFYFFVSDTGCGIPARFQNRIFQRFHQVEYKRHVKQTGTGLGLSISKAFVEQMGGRMWFDSTEGKGTVFSFTLPKVVLAHADIKS